MGETGRARRMRQGAALVVLASLLLVAPPAHTAGAADTADATGGARAERDRIRGVWDDFASSLARRDADAALGLVSTGSLDAWSQACRVARVGSLDEVEALAPGPRLLVLGLRLAAPPFLRQAGTPAELAARAVRAGLADRGALDAVDLGDVAISNERAGAVGDRASAVVLALGLPAGFRVGFVREDGAWKLDLPSSLDGVGTLLTRTARANGVGESAVIVNLLAAVSGRPVGGAVWRPLAPGGGAGAPGAAQRSALP